MKLRKGVLNEWVYSITLGDASREGHGISETYHVRLFGSDVSPEKLQENFKKTVDLTGVNPFDFCGESNSNIMPEGDWDKLIQAGLDVSDLGFNPLHPKFGISGGYFQYEEYSFLNLIMWYITQRTRITWNEVSYDELFSGIGSLIDTDYKSNATHAAPGYGLFDL